MNGLANRASCTLAILAAFTVASAYLLDGPDDIASAQDIADYSAALADGGKAHCAALGRVPVWTHAGDLVCRAPARPLLVARGGQP